MKNIPSRNYLIPALFAVAPFAMADGHSPDFFGSLNVGVEYRMMEDDDVFPNHFEVQDAYSYVGIKGEEKVTDTMTGFYTYKVYLNVADGEISKSRQTAWYGKDVRREHNVAKVGVKDSWGSVATGRMWNEYYNRISYTTDRFYSGWTGFDTYASFQTDRTLSYYSPNFSGFDVAVNLVQPGADEAGDAGGPGDDDTRIIIGVTYATDLFSVSFAYDDQGEDPDVNGDEESDDLMAIAAETNMGDLRLGLKYEMAGKGSGNATSSSGKAEDAALLSVIAGYTMGKHAFQVMYATGDYLSDYPVNTDDSDATKHGEGSEIGVGYTQTVSANMTYFAEYHFSDDYCAYEVSDGTAAAGVDTGCSVVSTGIHFGF